ncbi:MAG: efflux RND transporter periplasmic adaptor subunit [Candidatus Thiodiazotropha sp. (ex Ctena orbiculata)]|uniref:Efflux RND transporter periplasmic adaptor subunit n=1 Tax=Candidatus Thiodiazotropha taylori TaxID=2792791 RepID=A0A944MFF1_9GAMM|nr:efflux RND transporter periplasmic adaptor subunit [Candidatus Thiodiazotropha taylori]MBT2990863.1 efflux RND transporter periplasmic adaptor subunit [Candidatus Thiodiazotropha taylori]MBT2995696.1 efflux RND transporter periplasmic adaptor subunit [Candidatus Thiodiazotropha taylori]MBT2999349.1 efflux RND transporter periplasmic adaptor subunit [Candidatus Thiodiazotropha taylori]MBT3025582.1 efflux RND transporter periplasmic adaptor subunit [Candidatus Thiodiazotropha taylori]
MDGVIEPSMSVELSSRIDGILEAVSVDVGDRIERHQVIAKLESEVELAALEYARAKASINSDVRLQEVSLAYGRRQLGRVKELHEKNLSSFQDFDKVETETRLTRYRLAQAKENKFLAELDLKQAEALYNRHTIRSPIGGIVVERYLNPGESVEERPIIKIARINPLRVEVVAPITMLGKVKTGQLALVTPELPVGGNHQAVVKIVDPILDAASGTFRIRLEIPNDDYSLTSGLRCQVSFLDKMVETAPDSTVENQPDAVVGNRPSAETLHTPESAAADSGVADNVATRGGEQKAGKKERYLVVTQDSLLPLKKALHEAESFKQKGVEDTYVIAKGSLKGHISLGYFKNRRVADNYRKQLAGMGIETRIVVQ